MSNVAYLPIEADRYGACVRTVRIVGLDLTGVAMRAQVRLAGDTPGAPAVDLQTVTNGNAEGLRLTQVTVAGGVPTSVVEIVINEATMKSLPYAGEIGDATHLAWDWQATLAGRKQRIAKGPFVVAGDGVTGADNAPADRAQGWSHSLSQTGGMRVGATLTFGAEVTEISIDGAGLVAPLVEQATDAAQQASTEAALAMSAANAAVAALNPFPSQAAGEAGTAVGGLFSYRDGASGLVAMAQRQGAGSAVLPLYFGADKIAVAGWGSVAAAVARMLARDANGNLAIGTDTATNGLVEVKTTAIGQPATRGIVVSHYANGVGSYGIDARGYAGASTVQVIHVYSGLIEDGPTCGIGLQIDHTKSGTMLVLKNDENPTTSPGTKGRADFLTLTGYGGQNRDERVTNLATWQANNQILLPDVYSPLRFFGAGVVILGTTATRGATLDVAAGKVGMPAVNIAGKDQGLQVVTSDNGNSTVNIVKGGNADGAVIRVVNGGFGPMLLLANGVGAQMAAIGAAGEYFVRDKRVIGERKGAIALPSGGGTADAEARAAITAIIDRLGPVNGHGLIEAS